jgi:uncharacterized protein (TIGR00369 family)
VEGLLELGRAVLASQPFSAHVGAELARLEPGEAELVLPIRPHLGQQNGFVHGGAISFLVDNAITFAGGSVLGPDVLTQEIKVSYLRPGKGEQLVARASVIHGSQRQAVSRCDVFSVQDGAETICATALGTVLAVEAP